MSDETKTYYPAAVAAKKCAANAAVTVSVLEPVNLAELTLRFERFIRAEYAPILDAVRKLLDTIYSDRPSNGSWTLIEHLTDAAEVVAKERRELERVIGHREAYRGFADYWKGQAEKNDSRIHDLQRKLDLSQMSHTAERAEVERLQRQLAERDAHECQVHTVCELWSAMYNAFSAGLSRRLRSGTISSDEAAALCEAYANAIAPHEVCDSGERFDHETHSSPAKPSEPVPYVCSRCGALESAQIHRNPGWFREGHQFEPPSSPQAAAPVELPMPERVVGLLYKFLHDYDDDVPVGERESLSVHGWANRLIALFNSAAETKAKP